MVYYDQGMFEEVNYQTSAIPVEVRAGNTPVDARSYISQLGFFGQDSWTLARRLTLNLGFRVDRATG